MPSPYTPAASTLTAYGFPNGVPVAQPGWTIEADGFGLLQAQVKFKWDNTRMGDFTTTFARGVTLDELVSSTGSDFANLALWKANMVMEKGEVLTVTADFCGIDPSFNEGKRTQPIIAATGGASSEPIEHHPNFLVKNCTFGSLQNANVLAGFPPAAGFDPSTTTNPNRALWTPKVTAGGALQGQQFVGFLPNQNASEYPDHINIKAGIKNYYKPQMTLRVLQYIKNETDALDMASYIGWITDGTEVNLPPAYKQLATLGGYKGSPTYTSDFAKFVNPGFLVTNTSVELFGNIYKVTCDLMLSGIAGWDQDIYPAVQGPS
jgi:hypothetical protein